MGFYKDCEGLCFFLSVHFIFFIQVYLVYKVDDKEITSQDNDNIILLFHKLTFYTIMFLTFYSHFQIAKSDPGIIDNINNIDMLEFYYFIYKEIIQLRQEYNLKYKENLNDIYERRYSTDEDEEIEPKTEIKDKMKNLISRKFKMTLTRCNSCYSVRPFNSHHCRVCHSCILEQDHHCPWINNCVGIFNKKYFILFNLYAFISVIYGSSIYYYYTVFKNYKCFKNDLVQYLISIFWGLFAFIYGLFVLIMVIEQRDNVVKEFRKYRKDKEIRRKMMKIKMRIIFGSSYSLKWFLPFFEGGKRYIYFYLRQKKLDFYLEQKEKQQEKENNISNK